MPLNWSPADCIPRPTSPFEVDIVLLMMTVLSQEFLVTLTPWEAHYGLP
jgi:hypothetical protein